MLLNKNANVLAFDEVIGTGTSFEGNNPSKSIIETNSIVRYLIQEECYTDEITHDILSELLEIVSKTKSKIDLSEIERNNNNYYLVGWTGHAILLFYEKKSEDVYSIGIINAGEGVEIQGHSTDLGNCIIIFNNISYTNLYNFLDAYKTWIINDQKRDDKYNYYSFYFLLFEKLLNSTSYNVDFPKLIDSEKIECLQMNVQHIGSCTFTNHINYLCYLIYKDISKTDYNKIYLEWYAKAKNIMKKKLYTEIISDEDNKKKYYFTYKYILDTIDDPSLKPNIRYESLVNNIYCNYIKYDYQMLTTINISRNEIYKGEYKDIFWKLYSNNNEPFINKIKQLLKEKEELELQRILDALFEFYKNNKRMDNDIFYIIPLLELYNLKKNHIIIDDKILISLYKKYLKSGNTNPRNISHMNQDNTIELLYTLIICILLNDQKSPYPNGISDLNKKIYMYFLSYIPIVNGYYNASTNDASINNLIIDIILNINLFPPFIEGTKEDIGKFPALIYYLPEFNHIFLKERRKNYVDDYHIHFKKIDIDNNFNNLYFSNPIGDKKQFTISFMKINKDDFLLDNILLKNIVCDGRVLNGNMKYEKYNFIIPNEINLEKDFSSNKIFELDDNIITNIFNNKIGKYNPYKSKILMFKDEIKKNLLSDKVSDKVSDKLSDKLSDLKNYIFYFYLCELDGTDMELDIFKLYKDEIDGYLIDNYNNMKELICTYILKYDKILHIEYKFLEIKHNTLIPKSEKHYFIKNNKYKYILKDGYCKSATIDFFIINYNKDTTIVLYKKNENTIKSVEIIKKLFENNYNIYLGLNFDFKHDTNEYDIPQITGTNKINSSIKIHGDYNAETKNITNLIYIKDELKYDILTNDQIDSDANISDNIRNFYRIMTFNDNILLFYKSRINDIYYIELHNYDLLFEASKNKIYYYLNSIKYEVLFNYDEDTYNNFGIFTLLNASDQIDKKLLCIYNYNNILTSNEDIKDIYYDYSFIYISPNETIYRDFDANVGVKDDDIIPEKYIKYYYTIINTFDNKYIIKNEEDTLSILINCLYYNSPLLLLKTIRQIEQIIRNKIDTKLINTLLLYSKNAYSLVLYELLNSKNYLHNYNYYYFNRLFDKYNLNINTTIPSHTTFHYLKLELDQKFVIDNNDVYIKYLNLSHENNMSFYVTEEKCDSIVYNYKHKWSTNIPPISFFISYNNTFRPVDKSKIINYDNYKYNRPDDILFEKLLKVNIGEINKKNLKINIEKAEKFCKYLVNDKKEKLFPVQELIMGSGKSSVITPYLCLLLIDHFIKTKNFTAKIYIVMPELLISQSYETLMKNLFILNFYIEILLYRTAEMSKANRRIPGSYPNTSLYSNSIKIIIISDTDYKEMFLKNITNTTNSYMIYDEVDIMANPLTCELNIPKPDTKTSLSNIDLIFDLTKNIYKLIFIKDEFWKEITEISSNVNNNNIHKYIFSNINLKQKEYINKYFDEKIALSYKDSDKKSLIEYFKSNILDYILTKQFNYEYGLPDVYPDNTTPNYMYRAIPYSGGDAPLYGSDFSDPILTYTLTYFCYYLNLERNKLRKIDKIDIINIYEQNYKDISLDESSQVEFLKKFNGFFNKNIIYMKKYFENREIFLNEITCGAFDVDADIFEQNIKQILDKDNNKNYYKQCQNISFNDLLLHKNVKNIVSFTGTAYIELPTESNISYEGGKQIEYGKINHLSIEEAIQSIIINPIKTKLYGMNDSDNLINDIFSCIGNYDVLIDIGAVFINYTNEAFKLEYKKVQNRKKYLVYFENSINIYNMDTNTYESKSAIDIKEKDTFFYFSNKNITGVDAKDIMNKQAKGLVTITNKTILRDFSQGIFRMRNILDGDQSIDIVINKIMIDSDNKSIMRGGGTSKCKIKDMSYNKINRTNLFKVLKNNQTLLDEEKRSFLFKQNIIGLLKRDTVALLHYLYNDPSNIHEDYSTKIEEIIENKIKSNDIINFKFLKDAKDDELDLKGIRLLRDLTSLKKLINTKFDINNINDQNIISIMLRWSKYLDKHLIKLINAYFTQKKGQNMQINRSINVVEEQQKQDKKQDKKQDSKSTNININISRFLNSGKIAKKYFITADLRLNRSIIKNKIIFCSDMTLLDCTEILFVLYDKQKNNIYVLDKITFNFYLMYNNITNLYEKYIIISLVNNTSFGNEEKENQIQIIKIFVKKLILYFSGEMTKQSEEIKNKINNLYRISSKELSFISDNQNEFDEFNNSIESCYYNFYKKSTNAHGGYYNKNTNLDGGYYNKYLKYKSKYLALKNINSL